MGVVTTFKAYFSETVTNIEFCDKNHLSEII